MIPLYDENELFFLLFLPLSINLLYQNFEKKLNFLDLIMHHLRILMQMMTGKELTISFK